MAELLITLPDGRTQREKLGVSPQAIGRHASCEISIEDPSMSRRHARFVPTSDGYRVEDLNSKNGLLVNDEPCASKTLQDGDRVLIGSVLAIFSSEDGAAPTTAVTIMEDALSSNATRYTSRDQQLLLSQQRLQMIYDLSERLTTLQSRDQLFEAALDICFETLGFERGVIGVRKPNSRVLDWPVVRKLRGPSGELTISRSLLTRALEDGERAIFTGGGATDPTVSMVELGIQSAMCVPLLHKETTLGVIYGDRLSASAAYTSEDIDFMAAIAHHVTIGLINSQLLAEKQQMARLSRDVELARKIQTGLFPQTLATPGSFRADALNEPGLRVSGDYYDVIETKDARVWCLVADVTGEGVSASLLMANLQAVVRATIRGADDPGTLLAVWNRLICDNTDSSKFITCILALVDPATRSVRYASAGHPAPLMVRGERPPEPLPIEPGLPLGVSEDASFETSQAQLGEEPVALCYYTDGVIEAMDEQEAFFGADRLIATLTNPPVLQPKALVKRLRTSVAEFVGRADPSDDITILVISLT